MSPRKGLSRAAGKTKAPGRTEGKKTRRAPKAELRSLGRLQQGVKQHPLHSLESHLREQILSDPAFRSLLEGDHRAGDPFYSPDELLQAEAYRAQDEGYSTAPDDPDEPDGEARIASLLESLESPPREASCHLRVLRLESGLRVCLDRSSLGRLHVHGRASPEVQTRGRLVLEAARRKQDELKRLMEHMLRKQSAFFEGRDRETALDSRVPLEQKTVVDELSLDKSSLSRYLEQEVFEVEGLGRFRLRALFPSATELIALDIMDLLALEAREQRPGAPYAYKAPELFQRLRRSKPRKYAETLDGIVDERTVTALLNDLKLGERARLRIYKKGKVWWLPR